MMTNFLVIKMHSTYNAIIGQLTLKVAQVVVSMYHLKVKFSTEHRVREMKGNQVVARECYSIVLKDGVD